MKRFLLAALTLLGAVLMVVLAARVRGGGLSLQDGVGVALLAVAALAGCSGDGSGPDGGTARVTLLLTDVDAFATPRCVTFDVNGNARVRVMPAGTTSCT